MKISTNTSNIQNHIKFLKVIDAIHFFLQKRGYLHVDVPLLSPCLIPEPYCQMFQTSFHYFDTNETFYLTPSPELFLKRLLSLGIGNCYSIGKSFRNAEPTSDLHSFEFTILEFYKIKATYMDIAHELLELLKHLARVFYGNEKIQYKHKQICFDTWEKITVEEAFQRYAKINRYELFHQEAFLKRAKQKGYATDNSTYEDIFSQIYVVEIEPKLGKNGFPTLIYNYPKEFSALAKLNLDGKTAQRFEFYIEGIELGDCYSELTDWKEQKRRFEKANVSYTIDKDFIKILQYGLIECSGIAIGLERLAMIFADVSTIRELRLIDIH